MEPTLKLGGPNGPLMTVDQKKEFLKLIGILSADPNNLLTLGLDGGIFLTPEVSQQVLAAIEDGVTEEIYDYDTLVKNILSL